MKVKNKYSTLWSSTHSLIIVFFTITVLVVGYIIFQDYILSPFWLIGALLVVIFFTERVYNLSNRWQNLDPRLFEKKLFKTSLLVRFISVSILISIFYLSTSSIFEFNSADSTIYDRHGVGIAKMFYNGDFGVDQYLWDSNFSDYGFNTYLGLLYLIFWASPFVVFIANCIFSAITTVLVYRIAFTLFDDRTARLAGIMMAFYPSFLIYSGLVLKESLMIFLIVGVIYQSIRFTQHGTKKYNYLFIVIVVIFILFFFRTIVGILLVVSVLSYFFLTKVPSFSKRFRNRFIGLMFIVIMGYLLFFTGIIQEVIETYFLSKTSIAVELADKSSRGFSPAEAISYPVLVLAALPAPFPSFVYVGGQENIWFHIADSFIKSGIFYFILLGIYKSIRFDFRKKSLLLLFLFGYLFALAQTALVTSTRLQLVGTPLILIFAAFGIVSLRKSERKYWILTLFIMSVVILSWNFFKLYGRGLV